MDCRLDNGFAKFCSALPVVGDVLNPIARHHFDKHANEVMAEESEIRGAAEAKHTYAKARVAKDVIGLTSAVAAFALLFFVYTPPVSALIGLIIAGAIAAAGVYYLVDGIVASVRLRQASVAVANHPKID